MSDTFYDGTIVVAQGVLRSLVHILQQAEKQPNPDKLLEARLYEDMYPLTDQVRVAAFYSGNMAARLSDREPAEFLGTLDSYATCYERIDKAQKELEAADKDTVNRNAHTLKTTKLGPDKEGQVSNADYAHTIALLQVWFHVSTAYGILRKEGVPLGKRDFCTGFWPST